MFTLTVTVLPLPKLNGCSPLSGVPLPQLPATMRCRNSTAPASTSLPEAAPLPSKSRAAPRWSMEPADPVRAMSMAGLPETSAWVRVGPPLSARVMLRMLDKAVGVPPPSLVALMSVASGVKPANASALVSPLCPKTLWLAAVIDPPDICISAPYKEAVLPVMIARTRVAVPELL